MLALPSGAASCLGSWGKSDLSTAVGGDDVLHVSSQLRLQSKTVALVILMVSLLS